MFVDERDKTTTRGEESVERRREAMKADFLRNGCRFNEAIIPQVCVRTLDKVVGCG